MRILFLLFVMSVTGCASWSPSLSDAATTARMISCTICQASGGPSAQAEAHAEALRVLAAQAVEDPKLKTVGLIVSVIAFALLGCTAKDAGSSGQVTPKPTESEPPSAPPKD